MSFVRFFSLFIVLFDFVYRILNVCIMWYMNVQVYVRTSYLPIHNKCIHIQTHTHTYTHTYTHRCIHTHLYNPHFIFYSSISDNKMHLFIGWISHCNSRVTWRVWKKNNHGHLHWVSTTQSVERTDCILLL